MSTSTRVWVADRWMTKAKAKTSNYGRGDRWRVVWHDPETKRERSRQFAKKHDADSFRTKTEDSLRAGVYIAPEMAALTVGDAVEAWLASRKNPKESSLRKYRSAANDYVLPRWRTTPLTKVTRQELDSWVSDLSTGTAPRREGMRASGGLAPSTIQGVLVPLNAAFGYAEREGWISRNPASGIETPKAKPDPVIFLTYPELESLIEATQETASAGDALMVSLMGNCGLRIGEVVALNAGAVNLPKRRITITATMTPNASGKTVRGDTPKTDAGNREVPVPPHLIPALEAQTEGRPDDAPLFTSRTGSRVNMANWRNRVWRSATKAAGTPAGLTPKSLRHTAASLAIAAGADVLMVQKMLGHADVRETLGTYSHLFQDRLDEVTEKMTKARTKALKKAKRLSPS